MSGHPQVLHCRYGLGGIYYRQEKYDLAAYHFHRALRINPESSVLYCYLGMVLHASQKHEAALAALEQAERLVRQMRSWLLYTCIHE